MEVKTLVTGGAGFIRTHLGRDLGGRGDEVIVLDSLDSQVHDLAIIVVSHNDAAWLRPCLSSVFDRVEGLEVDVVVVDNGTDGAADLVEREFPTARVLRLDNRGFGNANNQARSTCASHYVLFLNPDTEVVDGSFPDLIAALEARPSVGLIGVRQVTAGGATLPTIRRFPNAMRALGEAFGSERLPFRTSWLGERELDTSVYMREVECDWTSGSFMLARQEAFDSAGGFDERFFLFGEEPDLCLRMRRAGWEVRHLPWMTIVHHAGRAGIDPRMEAQNAFARRQHALLHFGLSHRIAFLVAHSIRYGLRAIVLGGGDDRRRRRRMASRWSLKVLWGTANSPFGPPSRQAPRIDAAPPSTPGQSFEP